ncbi:MAG: hypothetical protein ACFFB3_05480 [Candidatus Hodarchaeota archaeon]
MRIIEITEDKFTPQIYKQYINLREEILRQHSKKKMALEDPEAYTLSTHLLREKGHEIARSMIFHDAQLSSPLAEERIYLVYDKKGENLIGIVSIYPSGGDEQNKTWVELEASHRILEEALEGSTEDLILQCENRYLKSHKESHGVPVARIMTHINPRSSLFNPLVAIGYQIITTTHFLEIPISKLQESLLDNKGVDIRIHDIKDLTFTTDLEDNLNAMIDLLLKHLREIGSEELQETTIKERIIGQFKKIQEDPEQAIAGGSLLLFSDKSDPVFAGFTLLFRSKEEQILLLSFYIVGKQRPERGMGVFQALLDLIKPKISPGTKLKLKLTARDTELSNLLDTLGFSLTGVTYDLAKAGPDRDKVMFDSYANQILGI